MVNQTWFIFNEVILRLTLFCKRSVSVVMKFTIISGSSCRTCSACGFPLWFCYFTVLLQLRVFRCDNVCFLLFGVHFFCRRSCLSNFIVLLINTNLNLFYRNQFLFVVLINGENQMKFLFIQETICFIKPMFDLTTLQIRVCYIVRCFEVAYEACIVQKVQFIKSFSRLKLCPAPALTRSCRDGLKLQI